MKICAISDLHGILPFVPECDVLCIAGDVVDLLVQRSSDESDAWWSTAFTTWANKLSCEKIFVVPGNHDIYIEQLYNGLIKDTTLQEFKDKISLLTEDKVVFLIDELYEYKGVTFYGTPWIAPIHWQTWAFEDKGIMPGEIDPDTGEENQTGEIISHYGKIPQDIDILLTHDNPFKNGLLSNAPRPKLAHLYGHWHDGRDLREVGYYNCSLLDDNYNVKKNFKPVIIDIMKEQEKISFLDSLSLLIEPFYKLKNDNR